MNNLNYLELTFIENVLIYYCAQESKKMQQIYSFEEIAKFRSSVHKLINKIKIIKEGE